MSEFECRGGHLVASHEMIKGKCWCGEPITRMDGLTSREHAARDRAWEREMERRREEDEYEREERGEDINRGEDE